jgi:hypothetical protein
MTVMRRLVLILLTLSACATAKGTPSSRTCTVLNDETQLATCVGKQVTVRGRVSATLPARISGVVVEADTTLLDQPAHAMGTLERDGATYVLKDGGSTAKAHSTKNPR